MTRPRSYLPNPLVSLPVHILYSKSDPPHISPPLDAINAQPIWYKYVTTAEELCRRIFLVLTCMKAALFTAIVIAFVLNAMSDLDKMSESNQPSSVLAVKCLWFMSVISSLAAAIWVILCLEWFASFTKGDQAEDYEEIAEKAQRRFEAMVRWRVRLFMAAIPTRACCWSVLASPCYPRVCREDFSDVEEYLEGLGATCVMTSKTSLSPNE